MKKYTEDDLIQAAENWRKRVSEKNNKNNYYSKDVQTIKKTLSNIKKRIKKQSKNSSTDWNNIWNNIVGEEIAAASRVKRWHNGFLEIIVDNPALRSELDAFYKDSLIESIRNQIRNKKILRDIKFISN